jgi:DNA-binding NtrC family response regulator
VQLVRFPVDTWLRRYRALQAAGAAEPGREESWDLARARSPALRRALEQLKEWAPLRVPVLLVGERGTGKTSLAGFLRAMSPFQRLDPSEWPVVVCGQFRVNPQLARSELFGHTKGAFSGAHATHDGLLERANGDTLFLDEVADIDRDTQRLLMAAVEGRGFQRLGDTKPRRSEFRLVSATNRALEALRGEILDEDFFDRIAVFVLVVPPLRECIEDLPDAWRCVLAAATRTAGVRPDGWERFLDHPRLLDALKEHQLPGNFRDLQRAAHHLLAASNAGRKETDVLQAATRGLGPPMGRPGPEVRSQSPRRELPLAGGLRENVQAFEREQLLAAMKAAGDNKSEAARLLHVPRKTFEHRWQLLIRKDSS